MDTEVFMGQDWSSEYGRRSSNQAQTKKNTSMKPPLVLSCIVCWDPGITDCRSSFKYVYFQYFSFPTLTSISTITALLLCLLLLPLHPFLNDCAHHFYYLSLQGNIWQYLASVFDLIISQPTHHFLGQFAYSWCNIGISSLIFSVHDSTLYIITLGFGVVLNQASGC